MTMYQLPYLRGVLDKTSGLKELAKSLKRPFLRRRPRVKSKTIAEIRQLFLPEKSPRGSASVAHPDRP